MISSILVVENDKDFRKTVCDYLIIAGYKVSETEFLPQAEEMLKSHKFDAAIVDVRMKDDENSFDWSGLVLARTIAGYKVPVVILTAHDSTDDVERAYTVAPGVKPPAAFISKNDPHYLEKLSQRIEELAVSLKVRPGNWLKQNWEKLADFIIGVLKKIFKFG